MKILMKTVVQMVILVEEITLEETLMVEILTVQVELLLMEILVGIQITTLPPIQPPKTTLIGMSLLVQMLK